MTSDKCITRSGIDISRIHVDAKSPMHTDTYQSNQEQCYIYRCSMLADTTQSPAKRDRRPAVGSNFLNKTYLLSEYWGTMFLSCQRTDLFAHLQVLRSE